MNPSCQEELNDFMVRACDEEKLSALGDANEGKLEMDFHKSDTCNGHCKGSYDKTKEVDADTVTWIVFLWILLVVGFGFWCMRKLSDRSY